MGGCERPNVERLERKHVPAQKRAEVFVKVHTRAEPSLRRRPRPPLPPLTPADGFSAGRATDVGATVDPASRRYGRQQERRLLREVIQSCLTRTDGIVRQVGIIQR